MRKGEETERRGNKNGKESREARRKETREEERKENVLRKEGEEIR